jgi:hypothetical protein
MRLTLSATGANPEVILYAHEPGAVILIDPKNRFF